MINSQRTLTFATRGRGLYEITDDARDWVREQGVTTGLLTLFCRHTSASLVIQENADPSVQRDLEAFLERIAPENPSLYSHTTEGPDDMPAHIRAMLTQTHLSIPVANGAPALGKWQGVYVFEHRRAPHRREIVLHLIGE
jgi:secondary thiamine-phosphate synthase enzyme